MLMTRIRTGAGIVLGTILVLLFSGNPWFLKCVITGLSWTAVFELYRATGAKENWALLLTTWAAAVIVSFAEIPCFGLVVGCAAGIAVCVFGFYMANTGSGTKIGMGMSAVLAAVIVVFFKTLAAIRTLEGGVYLMGLAMLLCNVCDAAAYLVGRCFGKRKLAPRISPNKTVEGSIGGLVMTEVIFLLAAFFMERSGVICVNFGTLAVYLLLASLVSQLGDLSFSAVKRIVGVKDYGKLLPGHGGILDRFDSLLFVLPFTFLFVLVAGSVIQ